MIKKTLRLLLAAFAICGFSHADEFPVVGATYQLDRAQFPSEVAICSTEDAMTQYMEANWADDQVAMQEMLFEITTMEDIEKMKQSEGCTLISSYSQAKIVTKGIESHQAEFFAFLPSEPMWGYYLYFGAKLE